MTRRTTAALFAASAAAAALACNAAAVRAQPKMTPHAKLCDVRDYGAQGTRIWFDTDAFQKAIDACAAAGGGEVHVPRGEWLIGPIWLKSGIRLQVDKGAEVVAGTDPALFSNPKGERIALINGRDVHDVAITGAGAIDGQGAVWWERIRAIWRSDPKFATEGAARQHQKDDRPRLVMIVGGHDVLIRGVTLENSPSFHLVLQDLDRVTVDHVTITAPAHAPNTDAIDPINSRDVAITNNTISVGDDAVAIKSDRPDPAHPNAASANIVVSGNRVLAGRGICIGSGTKGGVVHVRVENNLFDGSMYGFRIKTMRQHGGEVADVAFRNNRMTDVETPLVFSDYYAYRPLDMKAAQAQVRGNGFILGNQLWPPETDPAQPFQHDLTPDVHDVTVDGLTATGADFVGIAVGLPERPIRNLVLRNVHIQSRRGMLVRFAQIRTEGSGIKTRSGPPFELQRGGRLLRGPSSPRAK